MAEKKFSRREFVKKNALTGLGVAVALNANAGIFNSLTKNSNKPAILGGDPVRTKAW
ncbi:MAG: DegT/DnrJ/EryC1/StrS family aminotransferase, partial [Bacteroidetes bacterium]